MFKGSRLSDEEKNKIVQLVEDAVKHSDKFITERVPHWEAAEKIIHSYQPKAHSERKLRDSNEEDGFSQLKIPYVYGLLMAQHTYLCSVFLARSTLFQFVGKNGKGQTEVPDVETIIAHQVDNGGITAALYIALYDLLVYGVSAQFYTWEESVNYLTLYREEPVVDQGVPILDDNGQQKTETVEEVKAFAGYKGASLINVKPKNLILDPSVGLVNYQKGQFFGRRYEEKIQLIQQKERDGFYFDTEKLTSADGKDDWQDNPALVETANPGEVRSLDGKAMKGNATMREVYFWVIPADLNLGKNTNPELWVFTVANKTKLIGCHPSGWIHGQFPGYLAVAEYDGYSLSSRGTPEIGKPLNDTMNWLINTHMYNVEKAVNNEFIYDPSMINSRDFLDPKPGKRIRSRPEAYGKDVRTFMFQFQQFDYTKQNIQDVGFIESLFQRVFGVNEQMLGSLAAGDRKTATEIRTSAGFALNRLKVLSEWLGHSWFNPMGKQMLSASRQMYTAEDKFNIMSKETQQMREFTVDEIAGDFDLSPVDGSIPVDKLAQVAMLKEVLVVVQQMPAIAGRYDVAKFFKFILEMSGIKNMDQFEISQEDQGKIQQEAALGNLVTGGKDGNTGTDNRQTGTGTTPMG